MCCFPCWPFADVYLEDDPMQPYRSARNSSMFQYAWNGRQWVLKQADAQGMPLPAYPIAAGGIATTTSPMIPYMAQQQPGMGQPAFIQQMPMAGGGYGGGLGGGPPTFMMMPGGAPMPGNYGEGMGIHPEAAMGVGQTPGEVLQEQLEFAYANNLNEPQDFKPADDDKSRFYWVRELDGNWTQRSRATVDRIGCRWYVTDTGIFYAVRLPN